MKISPCLFLLSLLPISLPAAASPEASFIKETNSAKVCFEDVSKIIELAEADDNKIAEDVYVDAKSLFNTCMEQANALAEKYSYFFEGSSRKADLAFYELYDSAMKSEYKIDNSRVELSRLTVTPKVIAVESDPQIQEIIGRRSVEIERGFMLQIFGE